MPERRMLYELCMRKADHTNTVYHMLDRARKQGVKFLVVEPAKGEYKNVFGGRKDVTVLGTNPKLSQLLRINPFSFPENIHVLEHMDRRMKMSMSGGMIRRISVHGTNDVIQRLWIWCHTIFIVIVNIWAAFRNVRQEIL